MTEHAKAPLQLIMFAADLARVETSYGSYMLYDVTGHAHALKQITVMMMSIWTPPVA
jgi:hypothetical protein